MHFPIFDKCPQREVVTFPDVQKAMKETTGVDWVVEIISVSKLPNKEQAGNYFITTTIHVKMPAVVFHQSKPEYERKPFTRDFNEWKRISINTETYYSSSPAFQMQFAKEYEQSIDWAGDWQKIIDKHNKHENDCERTFNEQLKKCKIGWYHSGYKPHFQETEIEIDDYDDEDGYGYRELKQKLEQHFIIIKQ